MNPFLLTVLYKEPGCAPEVKQISNSIAEMEELVHGKIDSVGVDDGICVICNSMAELLKMPLCTEIYNQKFYGPILMVEFNENGQLCSLDEDNIQYYAKLFHE